MRRSCNVPRNSSCSSVGLASVTKQEDRLIPLRGVIARDAPLPLAPTGRPPRGSSLPCSLSMSERTCAGLRSSSRPPPLAHLLSATPSWPPRLPCPRAPGTGPSLVFTTRLSPRLVRPAPALSTSQTCSTSLAGSTPTKFTRRGLHCFAGSPPARCQVAHTHAALLATQEEWETASHQDG